ncbi:head decoration protein [Chelativorans sp. YIM 93263]|uniref:head decoration protein n=1 Tax=Chelativorans sp. YIM 93263 TaxID=2906648 RepID=UPI002379B4A3|nr:head decoration protein [Chelativorans sp. YIM 93263]
MTGTLEPSTLVGIVTATGAYASYNPDNSNGTENVAGDFYEGGKAGDERTIIQRDAEVRASDLVWFDGATAAL